MRCFSTTVAAVSDRRMLRRSKAGVAAGLPDWRRSFNASTILTNMKTMLAPLSCLTRHTASSEESFPSSRFLFCRQFLEARIVADLIPARIEPQKRRSNLRQNRRGKAIRYLQQPLENGNRVIGIPH